MFAVPARQNPMIDFRIDPELQARLDWMATFVREECEPLDLLFTSHGAPYDVRNQKSRRSCSNPSRRR